MYKTGLYWIQHDLRIHDNAALLEASLNCEQLICLYCFDPTWFRQSRLNARSMGVLRRQFLNKALHDLGNELKRRGQRLIVMTADPVSAISVLIKNHHIDAVYRSHHVGVFETRQWHHLKADFPRTLFHSVWTHTLFRPEQLPFSLNDLPATFTEFKQRCEAIVIDKPVSMPTFLSSFPNHPVHFLPFYNTWANQMKSTAQDARVPFFLHQSPPLAHQILFQFDGSSQSGSLPEGLTIAAWILVYQ